VELPGGRVRIGPSDWEAQGVVSPHEIEVRGFSIDAFEIDVARFGACVRAGSCRGPITDEDGGRAASLTFADAAALCTSEHGRLPRDDEWTFAAMGEHARRYPWGDTGAVCARAAYGLVDGPCATGAKGPDTVGARSLGASPEGIFDLAGNQAEWTIAPDGAPRLRGGSYASSLATELRGWSAGDVPSGLAVAGARCVYDD
jgi:formylglycine-generating enzyme required for sulfatase activity